jgi:predicted dehydrogenase
MKTCIALLAIVLASVTMASPGEVRLGIIGLDTSHVTEFTRMFNDPSSPDHVPGARIVAAYKGGSPDIEASAKRVDGFTATLRDKWKVEIVPDIAQLCEKVDGILLESVDGRVHLEQVKPVLKAKKPVFIDKPLAANLDQSLEIARMAQKAGVPWFSASSLRFHPILGELKAAAGDVIGCEVYSPSHLEPHHSDLFWYGIHGVEMLFTIMGPGCESVTRVYTDGTDVVVGRWKDGRLGVFRGLRQGVEDYGATVFGSKAIRFAEAKGSPYKGLVEEIVKFFQTGKSPVPTQETLEIMAFMQAAEQSKAQGGTPVKMAPVE